MAEPKREKQVCVLRAYIAAVKKGCGKYKKR
jgi:hypothetical protein